MAPKHVVVDGSNVATEGHSRPSLAQLDEAVSAFLDEYHPESFTVVVDATFGHRIPEAERPAFEEAILAGELVCPPAGAVGRGDAFVLKIADQADSVVFSNDSFQEFHGTYRWLFDEGRLIGGKPVPAVGWVFVTRTPVRGPTSRKATKEASARRRSTAKPAAKLDVAKVRVPGTKPKIGDTPATAERTGSPPPKRNAPKASSTVGERGAKRTPTNEPMPFLEFVEQHPVGSIIEAVVDRFSSHGAYVTFGALEAYAPLKLMGEPPPRRARDAVTVGESYRFEVHRFDAPNRGVDVALVGPAGAVHSPGTLNEVPIPETTFQEADSMAAPKKSSTAKKTTTKTTTGTRAAAAKKTVAKKATAAKKTVVKKEAAVKKTVAKKATAAKKTVAKKATAAKKTVAKKATAAKKTVAKKATAAKKTVAKKATAAKKAPAKKAPAKK
ncbi:MAG: hypothetical protein JST73_05220, partial [Actinobacteria bacterium]|nr:hypothetical protein [Actinomycetota bacterium]